MENENRVVVFDIRKLLSLFGDSSIARRVGFVNNIFTKKVFTY